MKQPSGGKSRRKFLIGPMEIKGYRGINARELHVGKS
jgi:hypothetical protein